MSKLWKVAGIAAIVAILGVAAIGTVALAQEGEDGILPFNFREKLHEAIAGVLGITVEEYDAAIETAQGQVLDEAVAEGWLTEDQAESMRERAAEGFAPGMRGGFPGMRGGDMFHGRGGLMGGPESSFMAVAADKLGLTAAELMDEIQAGKSIADLAGEKGVDAQSIVDAYLEQLTESLNQAVADGKITQKQADWMLQQAGERAADQLDSTWEDCGPGGRHHGGFRPGDPEQFPGQDDA